jgi:threonine dehydratase
MIGRREVEAAWGRIKTHVRRTPVIELPVGAMGVDVPVAMKLEQLQVSGTFKGRGAFHKLLASDVPKAGVIAASGGNHGVAVAYAAQALGRNLRADHLCADQGRAAEEPGCHREPGRPGL